MTSLEKGRMEEEERRREGGKEVCQNTGLSNA